MFVRKLVEKASKKIQYPAHIINSIQAEDVNPRLAFHYGVPSGSSSMAYDRIQHILAIATNDGRIKLFGWDGAQAFLQSEEAVPSKFLQFLENQGILLSVNTNNHIEVWDVAAKQLRDVYMFNGEITSFVVIEQSFFIYVGNSLGDVSVFKLDKGQQNLLRMQYRIPFTESHGSGQESSEQIAAIHVFPQPMAEARRVLIVFRDGLLSLWGIQESKALFTSGNIQQLSTFEHRKAVSACWVCNFGSKIAVGYSNGDLCLWGIPVYSKKHDPQANQKEVHIAPNIPFLKLNLGYKMDKIPITSLKWLFGDGRASRLYINGYSDPGIHSFQVIILNDNSESRTVKLALPLTEACLGMETISCFNEGNKQKQDALVLLLNSGRLCLYIDSEIENYLLKCQTKSTPSLPSHIMAKVPFLDSKVSIAKLYASAVQTSTPIEEDNLVAANKLPHFLSVDLKENVVHSVTRFEGFTKIRRLYVTGHQDGTVNFWDASSPIFLLLLSIRLHGDEGNSSNSTVTALHFDLRTQILACGDQSGLVHIISFKMEQPALGNMFNFLQVKQGPNYSISSVKLKGLVLSLGINFETRHLAVGTDKGYVFVIDMEGTTVLYQIQFPTQIYAGIISLLFENCSHNGYLKNTLLIATEDSSVIAIEEDTGNEMSSDAIQPKKPSRCLLMQILNVSPEGVCTVRNLDMVHENHDKDCISNQSLLLLCSENSVRLYSLNLAIQGIKKSHWKKKLNGNCCFASVVSSPSSELGLVLIFANGKLELRSLPDLTLLKETIVRGLKNTAVKSNPNSNVAICSSSDGELIMVNGDQEIFFYSVLMQKGITRNLESLSKVYKKDVVTLQAGFSNLANSQKEKRKGIFSMVGSKSKNKEVIDIEDSCSNVIEELADIFSTSNFLYTDENFDTSAKNEENVELDIDDIELEDIKEKPKGWKFPILTKQNLGMKFQEFRGMLKPKLEEKVDIGKEKKEDERESVTIDHIKKKYGYATGNESSVPSIAKERLTENVKKLQDVGTRSSDMQDTARSFSSMAKELLRVSHK